jgi:hypothetical protein
MGDPPNRLHFLLRRFSTQNASVPLPLVAQTRADFGLPEASLPNASRWLAQNRSTSSFETLDALSYKIQKGKIRAPALSNIIF